MKVCRCTYEIKNLYTILKNMYIWFEKYNMLTGMNDNGRMLVDGRLWMNVGKRNRTVTDGCRTNEWTNGDVIAIML